jgi:hypothetical protein
MSKKRKHLIDPAGKQQNIRTTKRRLALIITVLIAILAILLFNVGQVLWPA